MSYGARVRHSHRSTGPQSGTDTHPGVVGWWRTPRRHGDPPDPDIAARHRVLDPTEELGDELAPARAVRRARASEPRPQHHRPLTDAEQRARRQRLRRYSVRGAAGVAAVVPLLVFTIGLVTIPVPDFAASAAADDERVALIGYTDGRPFARLGDEVDEPEPVSIERVPSHVREAVLAAEDPGLRRDSGPLGRMVNQVRGGSTLAWRLVERAVADEPNPVVRLTRAAVLAAKIPWLQAPDQILGAYLNSTPFGRDTLGIQLAAHAYFGKDTSRLSLAEGALLAALIEAAPRRDPAVTTADWMTARWNGVLDAMVAQGRLDPETRGAVRFPRMVPDSGLDDGVSSDAGGHLVAAVAAELESLGFPAAEAGRAGLRITTTVDPDHQRAAVRAAQDVVDGRPGQRVGLVSVDPRTGGVLAYYGGENHLQADRALTPHPAGPAIAPFVVLAGLRQDPPVGLGEVVGSAAGPDGCALCDVKQAMTGSHEDVFAALTRRVGQPAVVDAARAAGVRGDATALSVLDLASANATLAAGGVHRAPHLVAAVSTADGHELYRAQAEAQVRFPEQVARNVAEAMLGVADRAELALPGSRPVALSTSSSWTSGFTPNLATAVWTDVDPGAPVRAARTTATPGAGTSGAAWHDYMTAATTGAPVVPFGQFRPIGEPPSGTRQ